MEAYLLQEISPSRTLIQQKQGYLRSKYSQMAVKYAVRWMKFSQMRQRIGQFSLI